MGPRSISSIIERCLLAIIGAPARRLVGRALRHGDHWELLEALSADDDAAPSEDLHGYGTLVVGPSP